jgi:lipopolysaccharide export system protein LptA
MLKRPRIGRMRWRAGAVVLGCLWAGAGLAAWASQPAQVRTVFKSAPAPNPAAFALAQASSPPQPVIIRPPTPTEIQQMASGDRIVRVAENPVINQLRLEGNANLKDDQLRAVMREQPEGVFSGFNLQRDVDGVVELYREAGWPDAKVTTKVVNLPQQRVDVTLIVDEGAKRPPGDLWMGPISITANLANREEDQHRFVFRDDVVAVQRGLRVLSDLLVVTARAPDEPGPGIKEARWEGDVRLDMGGAAATADRAVYDGESKTMTLSGNVFVQRGPWIARNDQLVIEMKDAK